MLKERVRFVSAVRGALNTRPETVNCTQKSFWCRAERNLHALLNGQRIYKYTIFLAVDRKRMMLQAHFYHTFLPQVAGN